MPGRQSRLPRRRIVVALAVAAVAGGGLAGCGTDETTAYADGWDGVCKGVGGALSTFRTEVSSAATTSPDAGDASVAAGPSAAAVTADLAAPARELQASLAEQADAAGKLDAPSRWATWNAGAIRQLAVRLKVVDDGVRRLQQGDADALALLAVGSVGPSSTAAPAKLRDKTPGCTALR
ncbi:hypothetical protein AB0L40_21020 [Patulibacter sp. NPDC049589]|uniref:hypothetical protein n=1 Tax=Patulibacter sp. NPDC049589 TaxID=3154731 RepID=UPI003422EADF